MVDGFNVIEIVFARNGIPIGCKIVKYRTSVHGSIDAHNPINIPLVGPDLMPRFDDEDLRNLVTCCGQGLERFERVREMLHKKTGKRFHREKLAELMEEAEWLNLIQIQDQNQPSIHWKARRVEP